MLSIAHQMSAWFGFDDDPTDGLGCVTFEFSDGETADFENINLVDLIKQIPT